MPISDWSSDVCSSDLFLPIAAGISSVPHDQSYPRQMKCITHYLEFPSREAIDATLHEATLPTLDTYRQAVSILREIRSEERRVGKECVSTCRSRWSPYH